MQILNRGITKQALINPVDVTFQRPRPLSEVLLFPDWHFYHVWPLLVHDILESSNPYAAEKLGSPNPFI